MPTVRFIERYPLARLLVFAFFRRPVDVVAVAPGEAGLRLVEGPEEITIGAQVTAEMRRWGVTQQIVTEVTELVEPSLIVEEQRQGPLRRWRVERVFSEVDGQTELVETIDYETPGGLLGLAMTPAVVERELRQAFEGRVQRVLARLGANRA
jgi:ligand-binding SRPBCC domain-containing protein